MSDNVERLLTDIHTELLTKIKDTKAGEVLIRYLMDRRQAVLSELLRPQLPPLQYTNGAQVNPLSGVDPTNAGRVGELRGAYAELEVLERILGADFEAEEERTAKEQVA